MEFILFAVSLGILALSLKGVHALLHDQLDKRIYAVNRYKSLIQQARSKAGTSRDDITWMINKLYEAELKVAKFEKIPNRLAFVYFGFCIFVYSAAGMDILTINVNW